MEINDSALQLHEIGVDLKQEVDTTGFLGVTLERDTETGLLKMKQTGWIKQVIKALGLDGVPKGSTLVWSPSHW
jgi:hypothetical protein